MKMARSKTSFEYSWLGRHRWNVLDLITVIARDAVPVTIATDIDMTWFQDARDRFHNRGKRLTTTAVLLKAIAICQRGYPQSRSFIYPFGKIATFEEIVAGFTVERTIDSNSCVFFGLIRAPHSKSLEEIMHELVAYVEHPIKSNFHLHTQNIFSMFPWLVRQIFFRLVLLVPSLRLVFFDATFGLSSLGKYGANLVSGPCVCTSTFGVGQIEKRPIVQDGRIELRDMMTLTLLYDQRCMDGGVAACFLQDVKRMVEGGLEHYCDRTGVNLERHVQFSPSEISGSAQ